MRGRGKENKQIIGEIRLVLEEEDEKNERVDQRDKKGRNRRTNRGKKVEKGENDKYWNK